VSSMTIALVIAACGLLVAATVQAATGFGFALIAGPVLYAVAPPSAAVALVLILGQVVNLLVMFGERRRLEVDWTAVRPALAAAIPGLPIGVLIITVVSETAMKIAVGIAVCGIVLARLARRKGQPGHSGTGRGAAVAAGFAVGVLTTSTTTSGPPLAIWLTARRMPPAAIRDAVTVIFFTLDIVGLAVLYAIAGSASLDKDGWIPVLVPVAILGHAVGRQLFLRLPPPYYEPLVLASAFAAGVLSIATGLASR
jgi:uncharacterized membrane protein YfcA